MGRNEVVVKATPMWALIRPVQIGIVEKDSDSNGINIVALTNFNVGGVMRDAVDLFRGIDAAMLVIFSV